MRADQWDQTDQTGYCLTIAVKREHPCDLKVFFNSFSLLEGSILVCNLST